MSPPRQLARQSPRLYQSFTDVYMPEAWLEISQSEAGSCEPGSNKKRNLDHTTSMSHADPRLRSKVALNPSRSSLDLVEISRMSQER